MANFTLAVLACSLLVVTSTALPQEYFLQNQLIQQYSYSPRILEGEDAIEGEFPYQISIQVEGYHICGGSLIEVNGKQMIITAAHCVFLHLNYTVVAGILELSDRNQTGHKQSRLVTGIIVHEAYVFPLTNDIALLRIDNPFELNQFVQPIPLPKQMQETTGNAVVTGWGTPIYGGEVSDKLQKEEGPIVDYITCRHAYEDYNGGDILQFITPNTICAGLFNDGGKGPCLGSSGGPLKAYDGDYLAGIVSFGKPCGVQGYPAVYTQTSHFIGWIKEKFYCHN